MATLTLCQEARFPPLLAAAKTRPQELWVRGELPAHGRYVAIVGTRAPTRWGRVAARRLSAFLAAKGWVIVSGLALGIDTEAHLGALSVKGCTVAVVAGGLGDEDPVYPRENTRLSWAIQKAGGALVSEQPEGSRVSGKLLVQRDALQAALSVAVIVIQCGLGSGTLHTVRFGLLLGREVFAAVPPTGLARVAADRGNLALLQEGKTFVREVKAKGTYAALLEGRARVAWPIRGRDVYARLEEALSRRSALLLSGGSP